jgi:hypothetical protein
MSFSRAYARLAEEDFLPDFCCQGDRLAQAALRPKTLFTDLWYLFQKGELIFMPDQMIKRYLADKVRGFLVSSKPSHESSMRQKIWRVFHVTITEQRPPSSMSLDGRGNSTDLQLASVSHLTQLLEWESCGREYAQHRIPIGKMWDCILLLD